MDDSGNLIVAFCVMILIMMGSLIFGTFCFMIAQSIISATPLQVVFFLIAIAVMAIGTLVIYHNLNELDESDDFEKTTN